MNWFESAFFFIIGVAITTALFMLAPKHCKCSNHYAAEMLMNHEKRLKALEAK